MTVFWVIGFGALCAGISGWFFSNPQRAEQQAVAAWKWLVGKVRR